MTYPQFTTLTVILAVSIACGTSPRVSDTDPPRLSGGSGSAEVTYRPNVHIVERDAGLASLLDVSTDGSTFVFDRRLEAFATLATGDVVLIKGLLARKVIAVETQGNEIAVLTVPAGLIDVVKDGQIRVQAPIKFGAAQVAARPDIRLMPWADWTRAFFPSVIAQSPTEERRKQAERQGVKDAYGNLVKAPFKSLMSGWETTFSAVPETGRLNVSLQLKKSGAGVTALITGEGYLADFDFSSDIEIKQSVGERLQIGYKKLNAVMNFKWEVGTDARVAFTGDSRIKLPAAIEIPLAQYLGGLPLFLELSSAVIIQPALTGGLELSHGAFRITFDGYQTFRVKEGNADADGKVTGDIQLLESKNLSAVAPLGMVVAFAAPRIELSFGMSKVFKFEGFMEAAGKADKIFDLLAKRVFGQEALDKYKSSAQAVTATKLVEMSMKSDAAAFIELVTSTGMSHSGLSAITPCTRVDMSLSAIVGTSATALGQKVGDARKEIFKKALTTVMPKGNRLCAP